MVTTDGAPHQDPNVFSSDNLPGDTRKHLLAGLAIARRSFANAQDDVAAGVKIDPEIIAELERTVADYIEMLDKAEKGRTRKAR